MEDETQFVPFVIHIATSDAAWLAAWAPDPRALGAHAMGLAALRGLLAEDMPKGGQPLGGEIQHARALIENARALLDAEVRAARVVDTKPTVRAFDLDGSEMFAKPRHDTASRIAALEESREASISVAGDHSRKLIGLLERVKEVEAEQTNAAGDIGKLKDRINDFGKDRARDAFRLETAFTYVENLEKRIAAVEEANAGMAHRLVGFGPPLQRIAALEEKAVRVSAEWRDRLAETNQRINSVENRCALLENDAENAAGRIAALEAKP